MASITIPGVDEALERKLRVRATCRNRSVEEEAREILRAALDEEQEAAAAASLADAIRNLFEPLGGVELTFPRREPVREPLDFE
jgi:plasmid stability protein